MHEKTSSKTVWKPWSATSSQPGFFVALQSFCLCKRDNGEHVTLHMPSIESGGWTFGFRQHDSEPARTTGRPWNWSSLNGIQPSFITLFTLELLSLWHVKMSPIKKASHIKAELFQMSCISKVWVYQVRQTHCWVHTHTYRHALASCPSLSATEKGLLPGYRGCVSVSCRISQRKRNQTFWSSCHLAVTLWPLMLYGCVYACAYFCWCVSFWALMCV